MIKTVMLVVGSLLTWNLAFAGTGNIDQVSPLEPSSVKSIVFSDDVESDNDWITLNSACITNTLGEVSRSMRTCNQMLDLLKVLSNDYFAFRAECVPSKNFTGRCTQHQGGVYFFAEARKAK